MQNIIFNTNDKIREELDELDHGHIPVDGILLKPSQCYHFGTDPLHVLFNTNCPSSLREKVVNIVKKYYPEYETGA